MDPPSFDVAPFTVGEHQDYAEGISMSNVEETRCIGLIAGPVNGSIGMVSVRWRNKLPAGAVVVRVELNRWGTIAEGMFGDNVYSATLSFYVSSGEHYNLDATNVYRLPETREFVLEVDDVVLTRFWL